MELSRVHLYPGDTKSARLVSLDTLIFKEPVCVVEATLIPISLRVPVLELVQVW